MPTNGTPDLNETVKAWADIVLNKWRDKITEFQIYDTGGLYNSLKYQLYYGAGNDPEKIEFSYNFYGIFTDRGTKTMEKRQWYSKVYYAQIMRLKEILSEKFGQAAANAIAFTIDPSKA